MNRLTHYPARPWAFLCSLVLLLASGCTPPAVLFLAPGQDLGPVQASPGRPQLTMQLFNEEFSNDQVVGSHSLGAHSQTLKIEKNQVAAILFSSLAERLRQEQIPFGRSSGWDLSLTGLRWQDAGHHKILGGRITNFTVTADSGHSRLATRFELQMDVDCLIGLPGERKIIRKTVHISEKVVTVSANQRAMEKVVDRFLKNSTLHVMDNIRPLIIGP